MKKLFLLFLLAILCILILLLRNSGILTELIIPKEKLFKTIIDKTIAEPKIGQEYAYSAKIPYFGLYNAEILFVDTLGNITSIVSNDSNLLRIEIIARQEKGYERRANTDWLFEKEHRAGGGTLIMFRIPKEVKKNQIVEFKLVPTALNQEFTEGKMSLRFLVERVSSISR